jgi:hypothetical protein
MSTAIAKLATAARQASDDWFKCYTIEVDAADVCGKALKAATRTKEPAYVVKEWQEAVDLHLAFASAAKSHL